MKEEMVILGWPVLLALVLGPMTAQACSTEFNETWVEGGSVQWVGGNQNCTLEASLSASKPSAAVAHFRRQEPAAPLRMSFRISPPVATWTPLSAFTVARGSADRVPDGGPAQATMFQLIFNGNVTGSAVRMHLLAACSSEESGLCSTSVTAPVTFPLRVTVELLTGEGLAGRLSYWTGDDTSGEPTAVIENLDNARWGGVERVSLGLADAGDQLPSVLDGRAVIFDEIAVSEPSIFWSDFERGAGYAVASNQPAIPMISNTIVGDTCAGTGRLPVIASGSTSVPGPKDIFPLVVSAAHVPNIALTSNVPGMVAFLCEEGVSTTSRCVMTAKASAAFTVSQQGRYQLAVGSQSGMCGAYVLTIGPLGLGE